MIDPELVAEIESCSYLFLRELREPKANALVVVLDEAIIGSIDHSLTVGAVTFDNLRNIEVTRDSRTFELSWGHYVSYSVRNESFAFSGAKDEQITSGKLLRIYEKSHFLDYLSKATWGHADRHVMHVGLICLNHVVDIASIEPPRIRLL